VLYSSLNDMCVGSTNKVECLAEVEEESLLAKSPVLSWRQVCGWNTDFEGFSFDANLGQWVKCEGDGAAAPEVAVTLIRKEDGKMTSLGDFVFQEYCSRVEYAGNDELMFDTMFSTLTSDGLDLPVLGDHAPPLKAVVYVDASFVPVRCHICETTPVSLMKEDSYDPFLQTAPQGWNRWLDQTNLPLRCCGCKQLVVAAKQEIRLRYLGIFVDEQEDQEYEDEHVVRSVDGLLQALETPPCAKLWV
jgi:hypothetical protein